MIRLGLIGCGRIGQLHAKNIAKMQDAKLIALADVDIQRARSLASELGVEKVFGDYHELLEEEMDGVLICSSTETHLEIIERASKTTEYIFCEKPLTKNLEEAEKVLDIVRRSGVKIQVGFNRRFDPNFSHLKTQVESGVIGKPLVLKITSRDPDFPSLEYLLVSGGIWVDMTIHDFDMARFLFGEVEEVYSTGSVLLKPELHTLGDLDTVVTVLRFRSGALGVIDNCRRAVYGYDQRIEVLGDKGMVEVPNLRPVWTIRNDSAGAHMDRIYNFFQDRYEQSFVREIESFVKCIREGGEPLVTCEDGVKALVLAFSAQKSFRENRPIKVEWKG